MYANTALKRLVRQNPHRKQKRLRKNCLCMPSKESEGIHYLSLSVFWQQLMDSICKEACVALGILRDAFHQLWVLLCNVIQVHHQSHLFSVSQSHLRKKRKKRNQTFASRLTFTQTSILENSAHSVDNFCIVCKFWVYLLCWVSFFMSNKINTNFHKQTDLPTGLHT